MAVTDTLVSLLVLYDKSKQSLTRYLQAVSVPKAPRRLSPAIDAARRATLAVTAPRAVVLSWVVVVVVARVVRRSATRQVIVGFSSYASSQN